MSSDPVEPVPTAPIHTEAGSTETVSTVTEETAGQRLDRFLAAALEQPRNQVQRWIRDGHVMLDGAACKPSTVLQEGDVVRCSVPDPSFDPRLEPEDGPLDLLLEDEHVVALNKPAGLAVHPGAGRSAGTIAHRLLHHYPETATVGGPGRPGIVHRLDIDTTGVLLVAKTSKAYQALQQAFAERRVEKEYLAIAYGRFQESSGLIDAPIARHRGDRTKMTIHSSGRESRTHYRVLTEHDSLSFVSVLLETGRTHQIRVHLKHARHPLVGDPTYGEMRWKNYPGSPRRAAISRFERPALHAWKLSVDHPAEPDRKITVQSPLPTDLSELWKIWSGLAPPIS